MLDIKTYTNTGDHAPNEDFIDFADANGVVCAVVADGLGGHGSGEVASKTAAEGVFKAFENAPYVKKETITSCFESAHQMMDEKKKEKHRYQDMKTTLAVFITDGKKFVCGHVGDTRIYIFGKNKVTFRTLDHSVPQMLAASGKLNPKKIRYHEDRNKLFRVMGTEDIPKVELSPVSRLAFNAKGILICTDGFWEHIQEKTMMQLLEKSAACTEWLELMKNEVAKNGKKNVAGHMDNYTCLGIKI